ncbi:MAG: Zn-binding domain-containing protein [Candidatus Hodarchaeales archaeon]
MNKNPENAIIDLENPYILKGHILCASKELPLDMDEVKNIWGEIGLKILQELRREHLIRIVPAGATCISKKRPAFIVNLNSAFTDTIEVIANGSLLETLSIPQAYREAHEGAILIHQGETYYIERIDWEKGKAFASQMDVDYYTEAQSTSEVQVLDIIRTGNLKFPLYYGSVKVKEHYHSYKIKTYDEVLDVKPLDLPPLEFETKALWFEIPGHIVDYIIEEDLDLAGGIHALEHATIALSPMYAMCDRWDIGGTSYTVYPTDNKTKIFIYDGFPGGIGITEKLFEKFSELLIAVLKLIKECPCQTGCPSCIQSPKCGNDNFPLDKKIALLLLKKMIDLDG